MIGINDIPGMRDSETDSTLLPPVGEQHQTRLGPDEVDVNAGELRTGECWRRSQWVNGYPDRPRNGLLEGLVTSAALENTDISLHIRPQETEQMLARLGNRIESLEADLEYLANQRRAGARGVEKDLAEYQALYDALHETSTRAFDVATVFSTRQGEADIDVSEIAAAATRRPANMRTCPPRWSQLECAQSASPIGDDALAGQFDTGVPMSGEALGSFFPFIAGTVAEEGVEYGRHAMTGSPVVLDRFDLSTGYCGLTIGKLGAGKSFSTKLQVLRRAMYDPECLIVMLDPMNGFAGLNDVLDGQRVAVGGSQGLNPLEFSAGGKSGSQETPALDPWSKQLSWVLSFFELFFEEVVGTPLGERSAVLRRAITATYERAGITSDPQTHSEAAPTLTTLIETLAELVADPAEFGYETPAEQEGVKEAGSSLLRALRGSFGEGAAFANLSRRTDFDLDSEVIYLDLQQGDGVAGDAGTSLMMHVLFNVVYERAKATDKRVLFVIDEAHYLMQGPSVEYLETAVRHSRHFDLGFHFVTQTGGEFTMSAETKTIAQLCSLVEIHRIAEVADTVGGWLGLNERELEWVMDAKAGEDGLGYSEALLCVDEVGRFPIRVRGSEAERRAVAE